jgi:hypothetical protein
VVRPIADYRDLSIAALTSKALLKCESSNLILNLVVSEIAIG